MDNDIYYKKNADGEFEPAAIWGDEFDRVYKQGTTLVVVDGNWSSHIYNVRPDDAAVIASLKLYKEKLAKKLAENMEMRPRQKSLTAEQHRAWQTLNELLDDPVLEYPSVVEAVDTALEDFEEKTANLLKDPSIRKAYEKLEMLISLKETHKEKESQ